MKERIAILEKQMWDLLEKKRSILREATKQISAIDKKLAKNVQDIKDLLILDTREDEIKNTK